MSQAEDIRKPSILVVDDEVGILKSIRRALLKIDVEITFIDVPEKAIAMLSKKKFDVVLSDMKMPNMTGAELLANVAEKQPDSFRIILSGYSDAESMLAAINHGKVHRYLKKPWNNDELVAVINDGIELSKLRYENGRLIKLTQAQNKKLANNNIELETKVKLRTKQILSALTKIQKHSNSLERTLYNVIVSHPNIDGKFARQVSESACQMATSLALSDKEQKVIRLAGLICEIGMIGLPHNIINKCYADMSYAEREQFQGQTNVARLILSPLQGLNDEVEIIGSQFDMMNQANPPTVGARIISICRDYWRYRMGRISKAHLSYQETSIIMNKRAGFEYDKDMLSSFFELEHPEIDQTGQNGLRSEDLVVGAKLQSDLYNDLHILLLPAGHVFTQASITKLKKFDESNSKKMRFDVSIPPPPLANNYDRN
jgi:response regulator RpfG family c-di-GMP phosphodiesterase